MAGDAPERPTPSVLILIILKVVLVLVIWLGIFLAMFMGYFTVPLLLVGGLALVYSLADLGLVVAINRHKKTEELRRDFLQSSQRGDTPGGKPENHP